jgi:hypothetical protein
MAEQLAAVAGPALAPWVAAALVALLPAVLAAADDLTRSQLRAAALEAVRAVVRAAGGLALLPPELAASVATHMAAAVLDKSAHVQVCQILPLPFSRYRFKFQSNLVWDSIKSISNFCFQF